MTRVNITKSERTFLLSIETKGHSGYADEGSDIVCAAVSSANELVINVLESFSVDIELKIDAEKPGFCCNVLQNDNNIAKAEVIRHIAQGYVKFIGDLSNTYPKYLKISTEV